MTEDEKEALREVIHAELQEEASEVKAHAFRKSFRMRCVLFVSVFIVGGLLHYLIEETALRTYAQSCELALAAAFDFIFNKSRE